MSYLQSMTVMSGEHEVLPTEHDKHDVRAWREHDVLPTEHDNDVWRA